MSLCPVSFLCSIPISLSKGAQQLPRLLSKHCDTVLLSYNLPRSLFSHVCYGSRHSLGSLTLAFVSSRHRCRLGESGESRESRKSSRKAGRLSKEEQELSQASCIYRLCAVVFVIYKSPPNELILGLAG